ncbi:unnamed protein product [Effrenium voratum]|nr:unnamed protein product [Effrenium voratum]
MQKDAADHVQWVCPRVLQTVVRICMVDRDTASCKFIDYGQERRRAEMVVPTAAHLTSAASMSELRGAPEIFLLLKPGHYDILVPRDKAYRLLTPESSGLERQHFQAVLRCLEEKLVQSLKRSPIEDLGLFRAQLLSVLEPLQAVLKADDNASASPLPALEAFLRAAEPQSKPAPVPAPAPMVGGECCICLQPGATLTAACGCAYHGWCLQDYTKDGSELCHLHRSALGPELLTLAPKLPPTARLERPGSLGAALGKPCVICFGEERGAEDPALRLQGPRALPQRLLGAEGGHALPAH